MLSSSPSLLAWLTGTLWSASRRKNPCLRPGFSRPPWGTWAQTPTSPGRSKEGTRRISCATWSRGLSGWCHLLLWVKLCLQYVTVCSLYTFLLYLLVIKKYQYWHVFSFRCFVPLTFFYLMFCPIRRFLYSTFFLVDVSYYSTFCPSRRLFHSMFCPIWCFVFWHFVLQCFLPSAFFTLTFCQWTDIFHESTLYGSLIHTLIFFYLGFEFAEIFKF